jgi:2-(1,2-epoxy-1,2-dihydrophenyl)acetyl-CoA isomerase
MAYETAREAGTDLTVTTRDGVMQVQLNRPAVLNALTLAMRRQLGETFSRAAADDAVRSIVLSGAGSGFCSGADVKELAAVQDEEALSERFEVGNRAIAAVWNCPKPVVALVHGVVAGIACALVAACDFVVGTPQARFVPAFLSLGLGPDGGASYLLAERLGRARTKAILLSGEPVSADEAYRWGLIDRLVEPERAAAVVAELTSTLAGYSASAVAATKRLVCEVRTLNEAQEREQREQIRLVADPAHLAAREGLFGHSAPGGTSLWPAIR